MAELMRRTSRQHAPGAPTSFRIYWRDDTIVLDPGLLGRLRRQLMSHGPPHRQLPPTLDLVLAAVAIVDQAGHQLELVDLVAGTDPDRFRDLGDGGH